MVTSVLAAVLLSPRVVYGPWQSSIVGGGGYLMGVRIAESKPSRVYAFVDVGGAYRSDDGGKRWRMLHGGFGRASTASVAGLSVSPKDPDDVILLWGDRWEYGEAILRSRNGGRTWARAKRAAFFGNGEYRWKGSLLDRAPGIPETVVAASPVDGVLFSKDGGSTWAEKGLKNTYFTHVQFDRQNPRRIWACAIPWKGWALDGERSFPGGFFVSEDQGESWKKLSEASPGELFQHPQDPGRLIGIFDDRKLMSSPDGGKTWVDFHQKLPEDGSPDLGWQSGGRFQAIAGGPGFYATASTAGVFYRRGLKDQEWTKLPDARITEVVEGKPWVSAAKPGEWRHFASALSSLSIDPQNPNRWFFTDWFAAYESLDGGLSWTLRVDGIETTVIHGFGQFPDGKGPILMGMADNGGFLSTNKGVRFQRSLRNSNIKMFAQSPALPNRVYAIGDGEGPAAWRSTQLYVSDDRAATWTPAPMTGIPPRENQGVNTVICDPGEGNRVWVTLSGPVRQGGGGVYLSTDGGKTFTWDSQGMPEENVFWDDIWQNGPELAVDGKGAMLAISRRLSKAWMRPTRLSPWTLVPLGLTTPNGVSPDVSQPGRFLIAADNGLFESRDGGRTAQKIKEGSWRRLIQDVCVPRRWAAAGSEPFLSEDGGRTFRPVGADLPHRAGACVGFGQDRLFVGTGGSGVFFMDLKRKER